MKKYKRWCLVFLCILMPFCVSLFYAIEPLVASFPEILLGQVVLSSEIKPLFPNAFQSAEFVLDQVALSEIEKGVYIHLSTDVLFWEPHYVGFARTELNADEIHHLEELLSAGNLFYPTPDGSAELCIARNQVGEPKLEPCTADLSLMDQYLDYQLEARRTRAVGVLQFFLNSGRLVEIRVYNTDRGLAYEPYEVSGDWWLYGLTDPSALLGELSSRATLPSIAVLWPEKNANQANARAARILGKKYPLILNLVLDSAEVREVFGVIQDIRPAIGKNIYTSWMDSTSLFLTLRVRGSQGEGAVIVQGYHCFHLRMIIQGIPMDSGRPDICP